MKVNNVPVLGKDGTYSLAASAINVNKKSRVGQF